MAVRQKIVITNELGLHARPAAEFVRAAKAFRSQIWLVKEGQRFSGASILEVLTANLNQGETAIIEASGPDAEQAVARLAGIIREFASRPESQPASLRRRSEDDF